jgi:hypothetical protein
MINWQKTTRAEAELIGQIANRVVKLGKANDIHLDKLEVVMDLTAAHATCPLKLHQMLEVDDETLAHDAFGIRRHLNRQTGELMHCFLPRLAA